MGFKFNTLLRAILAGGGGFGQLSLTSAAGFGDSITVGQAASVAANRWLNIVTLAVGGGASPLNQGISGTVLQNSNDSGGFPQTNNGRDRYVTALLGGNKQDGVFISYGFNDARYIAAPATTNVTNYANDLSEVLAGLISGGYAKDKIVVLSPYWISDTGLVTGSAGFSGQSRGGFEAFVTAAQSCAASAGVRYVDVYTPMRDYGGAALIDGDNIHPTDNGHAVIANAVLSVVQSARLPGISASAGAAGVLNYSLSAPSGGGAVTNYTVEYCVAGTYTFSGTATVTTGGSFTSLATDSYRVRIRANFADASVSPWAYSSSTAVAGVSGTFLSDSFTDTSEVAITSHTPETGGVWRLQTGSAPATPVKIDANGTGIYASAASVYQNAASPASANYYVEAVMTHLGGAASENVGIAGRMQAAADTFYWVRWSNASGQWQLYKTVATTSTSLGTYTDTFASGTKTVRLTMNGTAISVDIGGVTRISATDSAITVAGFAGIRLGQVQASSTGQHITDLVATTL